MLLSRAKPATEANVTTNVGSNSAHKQAVPDLKEFLANRDYTGAIALLQHNRKSGKESLRDELWIAFCSFHLGEYKTSLEQFRHVLDAYGSDPSVDRDGLHEWIACCLFYLGMYSEAKTSVVQSSAKSPLVNRLLFHLSHKLGEETELIQHHQQLQDTIEDQLCLASIHYLRGHYQEAIDVYKKLLLERRDYIALNVYCALCYYKLDYYDVSQEVLQTYLQTFPDSVTATNLKACNHYRLYNGKAAEQELRNLIDSMSPTFSYAKDLIRHNLVVFRGGDGALQVLPSLVDVLPEAKLNLVIYHLKNDNVIEANNLIKDLEPSVPHEYILKGVVNASIGQIQGSREHLKIAQQYFQMVGGSAAECDTIPGRQCMASCFFILRQFEDVLLYLSSIKSYFYSDDTFNFNFGQSKAATNHFAEAEEVLLAVHSDKLTTDYVFISWLCRCYIMNKKPKQGFQLYLNLNQNKDNSSQALSLLQLIANDCYKMGHFLYAAKAFDALERMDPSPEHWEGKRGSAAGVLQMVIAGKEVKESLEEVVRLLRSSGNPQSNQLVNVFRNWGKDNKGVV